LSHANRDIITFDYSPLMGYLYFVQKKVRPHHLSAYGEGTISRLLEYDLLEDPDVAVVTNSKVLIDLGSGNSNYGLPLQPHRIYGNKCIPKLPEQIFYSQRDINSEIYEMNDHLGNVRVVLNDLREWTDDNLNGQIDADEWTTSVASFTDYYAFGWTIPGRDYNSPHL